MEKSVTIIDVTSGLDAYSKLDLIANTYVDTGLLVLRGHKFTLDEHIQLVRLLGDRFGWNIHSDATQAALDSAIYSGGHADDVNRNYSQGPDEYVLDWHIEQVYYVYPILAGIWNMTTFTLPEGSGSTRFVDSIELFNTYSEEDRDFLSKSVVIWDKPTPHGTGPFYTKVVDNHPITGLPVLRVETDQGCILLPKLFLWDGNQPTEEQILKLDRLLSVLKDSLNNNLDIRYSQKWREDDLLIVDLFRMYHAVMGGFNYGERIFTGIGIRPRIYDVDMYRSMEDTLKNE